MKQKILGYLLLLVGLFAGTAWVDGRLELTAPGGGEMDLARNIMKYYGTKGQPVEVRWKNSLIQANYLEYYRSQALLRAKDGVRLTRTEAKQPRVLECVALAADLNRDNFSATQSVRIKYDDQTTLQGETLDWDTKNDLVRIFGKPEILYQDWTISGERIEGKISQGLFTIYGPVTAVNSQNIIRAGRIIFNRDAEKLILQDKPVFIRGKNEMAASEMIYDLKTKKLTATGQVQSRIIN